MTLLVTGGAGFIGSNFVLDWLATPDTSAEPVVTLDALTYAGNRENLASLDGDPRHTFVHGDICDRVLVDRLLAEHRPRVIVHFAAKSHVDRSIHGPGAFVSTWATIAARSAPCWRAAAWARSTTPAPQRAALGSHLLRRRHRRAGNGPSAETRLRSTRHHAPFKA